MAYNGFLYLFGGRDSTGNPTTTSFRTTINGDGAIGRWNYAGATMPSVRADHGIAVTQGTVYVTGGNDGSVDQATVQASRLVSVPRVAVYSRLIDTGAAVDVMSTKYTGFLNGGAAAIRYTQAPASGVYENDEYYSDEVDSVQITCLIPPKNRYFFVRASLDDSFNATFPDSTQGLKSHIEDITLMYTSGIRAPSSARLLHGKWFENQSLKPYDTCS